MSDVQGDGAAGLPARRISDDERRRAVDRLREAAGLGALSLDELEDRIGAVYGAKTVFDLEPITADLPATTATDKPTRVKHRRPLVMEDDEFRGHFTTYCLVIGMLVVIWLASGAGHPWPIYPAAGWGIGLGSHYQVAATHQRKRLGRARSLGISLDDLEVREREEKKARRESRRGKRDRAVTQARELAAEHTRRAHEHARRAPEIGPPGPPWVPTPPGGPGRRHTSSGGSRAPRGPRSTEPTGSSRRFVAAMFVDVVGSTGLNEALGDDGWVRVRERLRTMLAECFEREGGSEVNSAGDGILARFEHPNGAACAAVEIMRRLSQQRDDTGFAPSVRIGIHSGDVVEDGDDIIGGVVNLASRVTGAAEPDQVLVTEHVADHLDSSLQTEDRGIHSLRGVTRPRHLLALRWQ